MHLTRGTLLNFSKSPKGSNPSVKISAEMTLDRNDDENKSSSSAPNAPGPVRSLEGFSAVHRNL